MTQSPFHSEPVIPPVQPYASGAIWPVRTSGFAIASLACGIVGLLSFCLFMPSVLSIVFGGVALPAIKAGQARGKGLAISGIITGITGLILGLLGWIVFLNSPDTLPVKGSSISTSDVEKLRSMGAHGVESHHLIGRKQPAIADDVGCNDRGEPALCILSHRSSVSKRRSRSKPRQLKR